ncbi:hypothetical protein MTO96_042273 [Rhipicephalus appendiculatus]
MWLHTSRAFPVLSALPFGTYQPSVPFNLGTAQPLNGRDCHRNTTHCPRSTTRCHRSTTHSPSQHHPLPPQHHALPPQHHLLPPRHQALPQLLRLKHRHRPLALRPPYPQMNYRQLEESVNQWMREMEELERSFIDQSTLAVEVDVAGRREDEADWLRKALEEELTKQR